MSAPCARPVLQAARSAERVARLAAVIRWPASSREPGSPGLMIRSTSTGLAARACNAALIWVIGSCPSTSRTTSPPANSSGGKAWSSSGATMIRVLAGVGFAIGAV